MRLTVRATLVVALCLVSLRSAEGGDVDINVNIGTPRPPEVFFDREPDFVLIPDSRVRHLPDYKYDFYRYDDDYYLNQDGYWYRAKSWRGPFLAVPFDGLPRPIVGLPGKYRRHPSHPHGGPPGQLKKHAGGSHGAGKGHGKGHGKGKGKGKGKSKH